MYEILKHAAKQTTTLFTSPSESMARARFTKSAWLLKLNEALELLREGKVIDSVSKKVQRDEDGQIIFPEASSKLEHTIKSLYCIAGSLPAQFRSSSVDCGIGWKGHAKQEPRKGKTDNIVLEIEEQIENIAKLNAELEAFIQESAAVCKNYQPPLDKPTKEDLNVASPIAEYITWRQLAEKLVDGETFKADWAQDLTKNKVKVCGVDIYEDAEGMHICLLDDVGFPKWYLLQT